MLCYPHRRLSPLGQFFATDIKILGVFLGLTLALCVCLAIKIIIIIISPVIIIIIVVIIIIRIVPGAVAASEPW